MPITVLSHAHQRLLLNTIQPSGNTSRPTITGRRTLSRYTIQRVSQGNRYPYQDHSSPLAPDTGAKFVIATQRTSRAALTKTATSPIVIRLTMSRCICY